MKRSNKNILQPPRHGQIKVSSMKLRHAKAHLAMITQVAAQVKDYSGHQAIADSRGDFAQGGAAGADYQTTNVNDTPDPDWSGESR
jgi:hypothetical protein